MDPRTFTKKAWGHVVQSAEGYPAFVPKPAPRHLRLSDASLAALDEASNRLRVLQGMGRQLAAVLPPNPIPS